jgi:hypothetical protein
MAHHLQRLKDHPAVVILIWIPTIALLPGDWITLGGAVTSNSNLTRLALGLAGLLAIAWLSGKRPFASRAAASAPSPPTVSALDDLIYPPRDDPRELGERCASFASRVGKFVEGYQETYTANLANAYVEVLEADPDLDRARAREEAKRVVEKNAEATFALMRRDEGLELFDEARDEGLIVAKFRRAVERPEAYALGEVPNMFRVMARRLGVDAPEPDPNPQLRPLAAKLDELLREGMDLVEELSAPVEPERLPEGKGWRVDGDPPEGWWEKVTSFEQRIRDLLRADHPALLETFVTGHNGFLRLEGEADAARDKPDPKEDKRPDTQKVLDFVNFSRSGPAKKTEAILGGLAAARLELGKEAVR